MKAAGERPGTPGLGPLTSTPRTEPRPAPPPPAHSKRNVSSSSLSSESSEEDWLIKVCCPGARHRYCKNARSTKPAKIEFQKSLDKEDELSGCSSITSDQSYLRVPRKESSELEWLIRLRCPGAQMEQRISEPKQCLPEVPSSNKPGRSNQSSKSKPTESWLTQKHLSAMQHGAYLESYNPSVYDPYYLKNTDIWKVSIPPLCDPLLKAVQERYLEEGIIEQCDTGRTYSSKDLSEFCKSDLPLLPLSRQIMNPIEWLKIPSSYIESEIRQKSRNICMRYRKGKEPEKAQMKERLLASRGSPKTKARNAERNPLPPKRGLASACSPLPSTSPVKPKGRLSTEDVCPACPL
ncbi:uncharacterized protein LOC143827432 isoform X5 [Paroedura picta]|uniref:uncharacterized protein LOC143827432 isoform X5 n=1 Tax=Paroedura picta TaxID=143630 RepID=UPI00405685B5